MQKATYSKEFTIQDKASLDRFCSALAPHVLSNTPLCICLHGPLGAGKTTLATLMVKHLSKGQQKATSPSYNLVNIYKLEDNKEPSAGGKSNTATPLEIWHFDLYRLSSEEETLDLGLPEALSKHITIIEWANRLTNMYPDSALNILIDFPKYVNDTTTPHQSLKNTAEKTTPPADHLMAPTNIRVLTIYSTLAVNIIPWNKIFKE